MFSKTDVRSTKSCDHSNNQLHSAGTRDTDSQSGRYKTTSIK